MSLGEILIKALMDTLMGMGTVFAILILICIIISLFKFIPKDEPKPAAAATQAQVQEEPADDEGEIIAAIIAAIRMSLENERMSVSGDEAALPEFIVKSVKRRR